MGLKGKEILVIDDVPDICKTVKLILEHEGASVTQAESVHQGLSLALSKNFHLIITDLQMPGMSGFDFLRERLLNPILESVPTIVLSGLNDRASVTEAIALGAKDYVLKPIRSAVLLQKTRKALKDGSFLSFHFSEEKPLGEGTVSVDILKVSEIGIQIESSIRMAPDDTVVISSELLTQLECNDVITRTAKSAADPIAPARYLNDLNFTGIGETVAKKIRTHLKGWK